MKAGRGQHFEQSDSAPAAVEVESRLIVGRRVSQAPNDKAGRGPETGGIELKEAGGGARTGHARSPEPSRRP